MEKVLVLMSTYNGEKYLSEQLQSLYQQKGVQVDILVRDDGSTDMTQQILQKEQEAGRLTWYTGENLGPAMSFMNLLQKAPSYKYYAFCDQDDVWLEDKLKIAIEWLEQQDMQQPVLYYGNTRVVDAQLQPLQISVKEEKMMTFESMLINSNCTGCTMVFNDILRRLVVEKTPTFISMHDAWIHKICVTMGGILYYDDDVHILYRQHGNNAVGIQQSKMKIIKRRFKSLTSKECERSKMIAELLRCYGDKMSDEQRSLAEEVSDYRLSFANKVRLLRDTRIRTGYLYRDVMFRLAVLAGAF